MRLATCWARSTIYSRLTIDITKSDVLGVRGDFTLPYQRCAKSIEVLRQAYARARTVLRTSSIR
jgi:hypothetical protein